MKAFVFSCVMSKGQEMKMMHFQKHLLRHGFTNMLWVYIRTQKNDLKMKVSYFILSSITLNAAHVNTSVTGDNRYIIFRFIAVVK